jgi:hypothetical protein
LIYQDFGLSLYQSIYANSRSLSILPAKIIQTLNNVEGLKDNVIGDEILFKDVIFEKFLMKVIDWKVKILEKEAKEKEAKEKEAKEKEAKEKEAKEKEAKEKEAKEIEFVKQVLRASYGLAQEDSSVKISVEMLLNNIRKPYETKYKKEFISKQSNVINNIEKYLDKY